jgi:acyl-CoA thioesterase
VSTPTDETDHGPRPGPFATATAVTLEPGDGDGDGDGDSEHRAGRYRSAVAEGWDIAGNTNGGYLLAIAGRALAHTTGRPDPVTVTAHYLSPGRSGPLTITAEVVKVGKRFSTARATVEGADRAVLSALATIGDLRQADGPELVDHGPPELPPPQECLGGPSEAGAGFRPPFMERVDLRLHPDDVPFATGVRSGRLLVRGWFRLPHDEPMDAVALLCAADAFPPTIFNVDLPVAWTPTIELTVHVRARPAPGWLRCRFATQFVTGGFLEEDGELWDATGRLVAQSRQLALVPRG